MKYSNIHLIYFSPTHTSAKIVYAIAEGMGATSMSESDVTCESLDMEEYIDDELTIIAAPVYGGRVAETAWNVFACSVLPPCAGSPRGIVWEPGL